MALQVTAESVGRVLQELVGQRCEGVDNPHGSILRIDIGALGSRPDDVPTARRHGWRHLTVESPWRLERADGVLCDWNFSGGVDGELSWRIQTLLGRTVTSAQAVPPAWDLRVTFSGGVMLAVFSDSNDDRDDAWMILGTDGVELVVGPTMNLTSSKRL